MKKNVIITGAARDIGHAIAGRFLAHDYTVIAADIDEGALTNRAKALLLSQIIDPLFWISPVPNLCRPGLPQCKRT